jgi:hypothetical protein
MRRYLLAFTAAGFIGLAASPAIATPDSEEVDAPVAVQGVTVKITGIRDEAMMVLVGSALIGLAAAVRRAA